jgi:hypothetical protein
MDLIAGGYCGSYVKAENGSAMVPTTAMPPRDGATVLAETFPKSGLALRIQCVGPNPNHTGSGACVASLFSDLKEKIHALPRPSHTPITIAKQSTSPNAALKLIHQGVETNQVLTSAQRASSFGPLIDSRTASR